MKYSLIFLALFLWGYLANAQTGKKPPVELSGTVGISYDYYGLSTHPATPV